MLKRLMRDLVPLGALRGASPSAGVVLAVVAALVATSLFFAPSALAASPEAPETLTPEPFATFAVLHGVLDPAKEGPEGTFETLDYEFVYRPSATACQGAGEIKTAAVLSSGAGREHVSKEVSGLTQNTQYTVCLSATGSLSGQTSVGPPRTFTTPVPPEAPEDLEPKEITATSVSLRGIVNPHQPGAPGGYVWFYGPSESECQGIGSEASSPRQHSTGNREETATVIKKLAPGTTYTACMQTISEPAEETTLGPQVHFTTLPVGAQSLSSVSPTTASVSALINPQGEPTDYHVEYVTDSRFQDREWAEATRVPLVDAQLPAASEPVSVRETLTGLQPGTLYHFRFRASNAKDSLGEDTTFTTLGLGTSGSANCSNVGLVGFSAALPDCRGYELVSSAVEEGETYVPSGPKPTGELATELPFRAAADGNAVAYAADPGLHGGNGSAGIELGNEYLARRGAQFGVGGWENNDITPPLAEGEAASFTSEEKYTAFSPDLSIGIFDTAEEPLASAAEPQGPPNCWVMYEHTAGDERNHALFANTQTPGNCGSAKGSTETFLFAGESRDHAQLFFQTQGALTPGTTESGSEGNNLYDSIGGTPRLVSLLPDGSVAFHATFGGPSMLTHNSPDFSGAISAEGTKVFWTDLASGGRVYLRENPGRPESPLGAKGECLLAEDGCTVAISVGPAKFWTATPDGRYVFYTEGEQLWRFDTNTSTREPVATAGVKPGEAAGVKGVIGASADGASVYFVAEAAIGSQAGSNGAPEARKCEEASEGSPEFQEEEEGRRLPVGRGCNLYLWRTGKPVVYVGVLSAKDDNRVLDLRAEAQGQVNGDWAPELGARTAAVTGDGTHLVFASSQPLTGYVVGAAGRLNKGGPFEVFVYNATSGRISCASCSPTGAPVDAAGLAAGFTYLPVSSSNTFMRRWMNQSGTRVFFDTSQPLASSDGNGTQDVYEWEQEDTPGCPTATSRYGGCLFLLSGGDSTDRSSFVDADESGENVFLVHRGPLGRAGPRDDKAHLYDVRVDGGLPSSAVGCAAGCPEPQSTSSQFQSPPSVTLATPEGAPNQTPKPKPKTGAQLRAEKLAGALKRCHAIHNKRSRAQCERRARKFYGSTHLQPRKRVRKGQA